MHPQAGAYPRGWSDRCARSTRALGLKSLSTNGQDAKRLRAKRIRRLRSGRYGRIPSLRATKYAASATIAQVMIFERSDSFFFRLVPAALWKPPRIRVRSPLEDSSGGAGALAASRRSLDLAFPSFFRFFETGMRASLRPSKR